MARQKKGQGEEAMSILFHALPLHNIVLPLTHYEPHVYTTHGLNINDAL